MNGWVILAIAAAVALSLWAVSAYAMKRIREGASGWK